MEQIAKLSSMPPWTWECVLSIAQLPQEHKYGATPLRCPLSSTYGILWDFSEMLHSRKVSEFSPSILQPKGNKGYPLVFSHGVWWLGLYKLCPFLPLQQPEMESAALYVSFFHCQIWEISMCCNLADSTDRRLVWELPSFERSACLCKERKKQC